MERCEKCGSQKILKNDVLECIFCIGKKQGVAKPGYKPPIDPGEEGIKKLLNGVPAANIHFTTGASGGSNAIYTETPQTALDIMKRLSMPSDMKEFKQIKKIIAQLEKLIEVQNNDKRPIPSE